jgi:hypothetical protein
MKVRTALRAAAFALCVLVSCVAVASSSISLSDYRQQLGQLEQKIDLLGGHPEQAAATEAGLPVTLKVATPAGEITVNYQHLKDDLAALSKADAKKRPELLKQIQAYVQALDREADAYDKTQTDLRAAEKKAKEILSRHEFRKVHGPGAKEALLARIYRWIWRMLNKIHGPGRGTYSVVQILVWIFIGLVVLLLMVWTVRRLMRPEDAPGEREIIPFAPSARSWRSWLAEAREAAAQQDWRNAIHLAYWAGISYMESGGAWKPNRARTPREYLRLLGSRNPNHPPLSALTRKFELVWYGHRAAAETDFQETLGQLERLGCR